MNDDLVEHTPVLPSGGKLRVNFGWEKDELGFSEKIREMCFNVAFIYSMTYTYLETQAGIQIDVA